METKTSVWDGWEKQAFGTRYDEINGGKCALGFIEHMGNEFDPESPAGAAIRRVGEYLIRSGYLDGEYDSYNCTSLGDIRTRFASGIGRQVICGSAVALANNTLKWTPEKFREIDRFTQSEQIA